MDQNQEFVPGSLDVNAAAPEQAAPVEKTLTQTEVNRIVAREKYNAYQKGLTEAQKPMGEPGAQAEHGGMRSYSPEDVDKLLDSKLNAHLERQNAELQRKNQESYFANLAQNFVAQVQSDKAKYPDFDQKISELGDLGAMPLVLDLATSTGNAGDVMYELASNVNKIAQLHQLHAINPMLAKKEVMDIANSIKQNQQASNARPGIVPERQLRHSSTGTGNGAPSVRDLRNSPAYKV